MACEKCAGRDPECPYCGEPPPPTELPKPSVTAQHCLAIIELHPIDGLNVELNKLKRSAIAALQRALEP